MRMTVVVFVATLAALSTPAGGQSSQDTRRVTGFSEITVTGIVESFSETGLTGCETCDACSDCTGSHLVLRCRTSHYEVHLAPAWFLELHGYVFNVGDTITVTGTRIRTPVWRGITAREITRDRVVMKFRDEHGLPLWRRVPTDW